MTYKKGLYDVGGSVGGAFPDMVVRRMMLEEEEPMDIGRFYFSGSTQGRRERGAGWGGVSRVRGGVSALA